MGSPCGPEYTRRSRELVNGGDGDDGPKKSNPKDDDDDSAGEGRRKSTLILLSCDREPLSPKAAISFVGASPDECTYFFEARSAAACGGANLDNQAVGPAGVFGLMCVLMVRSGFRGRG
jgi:cation-dependent mannose-6-phosphate receptor